MTGPRVGVSLVDGRLGVGELAEAAAAAERAGYQTLWTNETAGRDAFGVLASWTAATRTARLGIGVSPVYARPPVTAAGAAAALTAATGRRLVLGIGSGHAVAARRQFGVEHLAPLAAVRDYAAILRALLAGERVAHDGEAFRVGGVQLPEAPPGPIPVVVGAMGPRMLALAADCCDGVLVNWTTAAKLAELAPGLRRRAGRPFEVSAYVRVAAATDADAARRALATDFAGYLRLPAYRSHLARQGFDETAAAVGAAWEEGGQEAAAAAISGDVLAGFGAFGTPDECRAMLEQYRHAGIDEVVVRPVPVGRGGIREAADAVAPGAGGG